MKHVRGNDESNNHQQHEGMQRVDTRKPALKKFSVSFPSYRIREPMSINQRKYKTTEHEKDVNLPPAHQEKPLRDHGHVQCQAARLQSIAGVREKHHGCGDAT